MKKVQLIVDALGEPPFRGSIGVTNKYISEALEAGGFRSQYLSVQQRKSTDLCRLSPVPHL
ncbi:MAG: hypothetical protein JWM43_3149 [Acidobacteriaceae bacterium]|nr:hypothetical protein [Acidobacteriaceae bacterium]